MLVAETENQGLLNEKTSRMGKPWLGFRLYVWSCGFGSVAETLSASVALSAPMQVTVPTSKLPCEQ